MATQQSFDVLIIGGSYSGLSAAMALGRSMRTVLIIDGGLPCNRQTPHSQNFITQDGEKPNVISEKAKEQVLKYSTVTFLTDFATNVKKTNDGFYINTKSGLHFTSKKLILATGIKDQMPEIKGFSECWGISVIHCPYCHGYEFRGKKTGIMATGNKAIHLASLVNNLTNDITIFTSGTANFDPEQLMKLKKHNINIIESPITEVVHSKGQLTHVVLGNNEEIPFTCVYAAIPFEQHSTIPHDLGCELTELGHIKIDAFQKTIISGVYACGDNSSPMRSVAQAVAAGNITGAMANMELTNEGF